MPLEPDFALKSQEQIDQTKQVSIDEIPIIDVAPLLAGRGDKSAVAAAMAKAFETVGFCYIANHGIPQPLIDRAFEVLPSFFDLPLEAKTAIPINLNQRGYIPMAGQKLVHAKKISRTESFIFGLDLPADDPDRQAGLLFHDTNKWPEGLLEFRAALEEYWRALFALGPKLLRGLALAMRQPEDFFLPFYKKPDSLLRCAKYPPNPNPFDGEFGSSPHSDNGVLTILAQDDIGGLQLCTRDGDWIEAPSIPGTFVINVGDMVAHWTNGAFRSTPHRVVSPRDRDRYSLPFFFFPDYRTRVEPLKEFIGPNNPPHYAPVVWGEYVQARFAANYSHYKQDSAAV